MKRASIFIITLLVVLNLGACSFISYAMDYKSTTDLKQIKVVAQLDANRNMATAIDVVFVFDKTALAVLPKTGPEWFANKSMLMANWGGALAVLSLEIPPAGPGANKPLPHGYKKAIAVYSYANYLSTKGQAMGNLTSYSCAQVTLSREQINYASCN